VDLGSSDVDFSKDRIETSLAAVETACCYNLGFVREDISSVTLRQLSVDMEERCVVDQL